MEKKVQRVGMLLHHAVSETPTVNDFRQRPAGVRLWQRPVAHVAAPETLSCVEDDVIGSVVAAHGVAVVRLGIVPVPKAAATVAGPSEIMANVWLFCCC